jgi:hypothetical protein
LPVLSFAGQYVFSSRAGTLQLMFHHPTVMVVDWLLVPFNWFAVLVVDWRRGFTLYTIGGIAITLSVLAHAYWQTQGLDPGHMISSAGATLGAGWVHLVFSTLETTLLIAFVFCRSPRAQSTVVATTFAVLYFVAMLAAGYYIHSHVIASDVVVFCAGLFFTVAYPRLCRAKGSCSSGNPNLK